MIVQYVWNINTNQQETNNEQPWKKWKHCEVHNGTYKPGKSIKYNEQHLKKWKCNEHLWRKDNEHVEVKTNKTNKNTQNPKERRWKNNGKRQRKTFKKNKETIMNHILENETHETKSGK